MEVHGDVAGIEAVRRALCDWLDWMGLIDAGPQSRLDRFIGYYEPYATATTRSTKTSAGSRRCATPHKPWRTRSTRCAAAR